jgi:hypothetical protein
MTRDDLFRGLLAALRERGVEFIDTREDDHHARFQRVVEMLDEVREEFPNVPSTFIPSPFTGRYREFLGAQNPFYPGVNLDISKQRAHRILANYKTEEQQLFANLASVYLGQETVAEHAT